MSICPTRTENRHCSISTQNMQILSKLPSAIGETGKQAADTDSLSDWIFRPDRGHGLGLSTVSSAAAKLDQAGRREADITNPGGVSASQFARQDYSSKSPDATCI